MGVTITAEFIASQYGQGIAFDDTYIYWANYSSPGAICRANLDGTGVNASFITGIGNYPTSVVVNADHIYWGYGASAIGQLGRANLDGSSKNASFISGLTTAAGYNVQGVAIDGSYIYWTNGYLQNLGRANLDGTGVNQTFITGLTSRYVNDVTVDSAHIYIAELGHLWRANLDGSGLTSIGYGCDAVEVDSSHVYTSSASSTSIWKANLDGTGSVLYMTSPHVVNSLGIDGSGALYWFEYTGSHWAMSKGVNAPTATTFSLTQGQSAAVKKAAAEVMALTQGAAIAQPKTATSVRAVTQAAITAQLKAAASVRAVTQAQFLMLPLPGVFTQRQAAVAVRNRGLPETLLLTQAATVLRGVGRSRSARPPRQNQAVGGGDRDYVGGAMSFTRIQVRRDTAANWTSANPVLADGEPGYEHDTGKEKLGDGSSAWADLPYVGGGGVTVKTARISVSAAGHSSDYSGMTVVHDDIGIAVGDGGYANTLKIPLAKLYHVHMEWLPQSRGYGGSVFSDINGGAGPASGHIYFASLPVSGITLLGGSIRSFAGDNWVPMFTTDGTNWMLGSPGIDLDGPVVDLVIAGDANFSSHGGAAPSDFDDYAVMLGMPDLTVTDIDTTYASNVAQNFVTDKLLVTVEALS